MDLASGNIRLVLFSIGRRIFTYEYQTSFQVSRDGRRACSDFDHLLLLADDRALSYGLVYIVVIGFIVSLGVFVVALLASFIFVIRLRRSRSRAEGRASGAVQN